MRGCSRRNTWQRFLPGEGIHTEMERRAAPEAFLKSSAGFSQYLSWRVWELWHHLCGICGFSCILVLCNKLDTKFNRDTASYTPQVTKCGGQLIMFSLGGRSVPEMMTPLFSLNSNGKYVLGLPRWLSDKRICLSMQEMQEKWIQSLSWEDFLEEKIASQYSILARIIPWTEEPGGLQFMESERVRHNWATEWVRVFLQVTTGATSKKDTWLLWPEGIILLAMWKTADVRKFSFRSYCLTASGSLGDIFILMTFSS